MSHGESWPPGSDEEVREYLARVIVRCEGNLRRVAWEAGIMSRHKLWLKVCRLRLWPLVNAARIERIEQIRKWRRR